MIKSAIALLEKNSTHLHQLGIDHKQLMFLLNETITLYPQKGNFCAVIFTLIRRHR